MTQEKVARRLKREYKNFMTIEITDAKRLFVFSKNIAHFLMGLTHIIDLSLLKLEYAFRKPAWVLPCQASELLNGKVRVCLHSPDAQWSYRNLHREEVGV